MPHRLPPLAALVATVALTGCGGDDAPPATTTVFNSSLSASNGEELEHDKDRSAEGVEGQSVCTLLPVAEVQQVVGVRGLRAEPTDSLDLSTCRYAKGETNVRVILDGAADATRRYYNQLSESYQKFNTIPSLRPHNVRHVGDDSTYGGVGAYWTNGRAQLVAFQADRIARVTVFVPGRSDARRKALAGRLVTVLFARMKAERGG